jgi:hypothetical protein
MGGNTVKVLPGDRRLTIVGVSGNSRSSANFNVKLLAGRTYKIQAQNWMFPMSGFKVVDQTTKTEITSQ